MKLTKKVIDGIETDSGGLEKWVADDELPGFFLRVSARGVKSFVVQYRAGRGRNAPRRIVTLGKLGALTPDEARTLAKKVLGEVANGGDPARDRADARKADTLADVAELWLKDVRRLRKPATAAEYERLLRVHILPALGARQLEQIAPRDVAKLAAGLADRPTTANRCLAVLSSFYGWAARRGHVEKDINPSAGLERNREHARERFLTTEELARLGDALRLAETDGLPYAVDETKPKAKHAPKPENRLVKLDPFAVAAIRLLILTGARLREILDARWSYVDFERGILFLPDSKTGRKPVYLSAAAQAVLAAVPRIAGNPYIIAGAQDGAPRADLHRPWAAVRRAAGLDGVRLHDLRHSFASFGAGASLGLPIIGKLLGHSQPATTARYAHLDADPLRRAADTIGATIAAAMEGKPAAEVVQIKERRK